MARAAYSKLLGAATNINAPFQIGAPPEGYLWVVRFMAMTVGDFLGFIAGGLSVNGEDPWLWLTSNNQSKIFGVRKQTFYWEGRLVVPAGSTLWVQTEAGDTADYYVSGYELSVSGS
jgi:hypothetical protein